MPNDFTLIAQGVALLVAAVAAVTDSRRGEIPNWLTLPVLALAPMCHGLWYGWWGLLGSLASIAVCGLVPYLLFRRGAAGGGDVKLFAAIGGLAGMSIGVEAQLCTFLAAAVVSLGRLAWRGRLLRTLANTVLLGLNPILPRGWRRPLTPELMTAVRLGAFAFAGTCVALFLRHSVIWA